VLQGRDGDLANSVWGLWMSNSLARQRTHSSKTLNADRDRRHARSSRELAPDPLMTAALDCFSLTLKVHLKKGTNALAWAV
jgi:hypothetical protein